jgi:uncharacterized protein YndB with AHSA1/START domain
MTQFETTVEVARPRAEVFGYVADARRLPEWNSAVTSVVPLGDTSGVAGRYLMQRLLPTGPASNELEVVASGAPHELTIRTTTGPTPFTYRYEFTASGARTLVRLRAEVSLGAVASALGPLAARAIKRGVDANFATLQDIVERGDG